MKTTSPKSVACKLVGKKINTLASMQCVNRIPKQQQKILDKKSLSNNQNQSECLHDKSPIFTSTVKFGKFDILKPTTTNTNKLRLELHYTNEDIRYLPISIYFVVPCKNTLNRLG